MPVGTTRIASISGLRGVVGDGLDPVVAVEFAAAYASQCEPGSIVISHDGRVSSNVFFPAVVSGSDRHRAETPCWPARRRLRRSASWSGTARPSAASRSPHRITRPNTTV